MKSLLLGERLYFFTGVCLGDAAIPSVSVGCIPFFLCLRQRRPVIFLIFSTDSPYCMQHLSGKEIIPGISAIFAFGAKMYGPLAPAGRYWEAGKRYLGFLLR